MADEMLKVARSNVQALLPPDPRTAMEEAIAREMMVKQVNVKKAKEKKIPMPSFLLRKRTCERKVCQHKCSNILCRLPYINLPNVVCEVENTIARAATLIKMDPKGKFFYPRPQYNIRYQSLALARSYNSLDLLSETDITTESSVRTHISESSPYEEAETERRYKNDIEWEAIFDFNLQTVCEQIRRYVDLWELSPATVYTLLPNEEPKVVAYKGKRYHVEAVFSKPTRRCPNPLAVASIHFYIHVPSMLPKFFPVMICYRFEGQRTVYFAHGNRMVESLKFQSYFIDSILHAKLHFFVEIFACRHPLHTETVAQRRKKAKQLAKQKKKIENEKQKQKQDQNLDAISVITHYSH